MGLNVLEVSNASELGRFLFRNSAKKVVHFTGAGRFSSCESGQALVRILGHMRSGTSMPAAQPRTRSRILGSGEGKTKAHGCALGRLCLGAGGATAAHEGYSGGASSGGEVILRASHRQADWQSEFDGRAHCHGTQGLEHDQDRVYLMGMCPLFVGMKARISCILPEPLRGGASPAPKSPHSH